MKCAHSSAGYSSELKSDLIAEMTLSVVFVVRVHNLP